MMRPATRRRSTLPSPRRAVAPRAALVALLVALCIGGASGAGAMWFHLRLVRTEPAADAHLAASPARVALWFTERPEMAVTRVRLQDARGTAVPLGAPTRADSAGAPVVAPLAHPIGGGTYTVVWRTMARDGHMNDGRYSFVVDAARR